MAIVPPAADADPVFRELNAAMHAFEAALGLRNLHVFASANPVAPEFSFFADTRTIGNLVQGPIDDQRLVNALTATLAEHGFCRGLSAGTKDKIVGAGDLRPGISITYDLDPWIADPVVEVRGRIRVRAPGDRSASARAIEDLAADSSALMAAVNDPSAPAESRTAKSRIHRSIADALHAIAAPGADDGLADEALVHLLTRLGFEAKVRFFGDTPGGVAITRLPDRGKLAKAVLEALGPHLEASFTVTPNPGKTLRGSVMNGSFQFEQSAARTTHGVGG